MSKCTASDKTPFWDLKFVTDECAVRNGAYFDSFVRVSAALSVGEAAGWVAEATMEWWEHEDGYEFCHSDDWGAWNSYHEHLTANVKTALREWQDAFEKADREADHA